MTGPGPPGHPILAWAAGRNRPITVDGLLVYDLTLIDSNGQP